MTAKILIVDDTPFNVKLLDTRLQQEYYDVSTASNGAEALEMINKVHPDIVLLDVMMPVMDGMETARRIKANPATTHIPIIMITALDGQEDMVRGLEAGADDFLSKPVDEQALMARLKSLLRLKLMMDELLLRDQTALQYGLIEQPTMDTTRSVEGAQVLLIEDDEALRKKIHNILGSKGISVDDCLVVEDALAQAGKKDYSVIIVNVLVMGTDGLRLCSHFKSHEVLRHVPILLSVDAENKNAIMRGLEMGVNDYITMPVEVNELVARVSTQIRRKRYQDMLRNQYTQSISMSVTDPLTGLYNRRYLDMHLNSLVNRAHEVNRSLSLLMVDVDHFKKVNDTYGHQSGDAVLKEIGSRILSEMRVTDMCARYGGEEFTIVMSETDLEKASLIAERLRHCVEKTPVQIPVAPGQINLTCSIGVATMESVEAPPAIIARADSCLYYAKEHGRNSVIAAHRATDPSAQEGGAMGILYVDVTKNGAHMDTATPTTEASKPKLEVALPSKEPATIQKVVVDAITSKGSAPNTTNEIKPDKPANIQKNDSW